VDTFTGPDQCLERLAFQTSYRVAAICQELGCSPRYVHSMFLRDVGLPPKQWLNGERMVLARRKLEGGLLPDQVARDLGFMSLHTFCKQFRKYHQVTPAKFVRALRKFPASNGLEGFERIFGGTEVGSDRVSPGFSGG
jgi:AraC-like DNA-binding protein